MRKWFRIGGVALVVVAMVGLLAEEALRSRQPSYQGKTLDEWLDEYNQCYDLDGHVSEAIRAMGTNSLPFLLTHIKHKDLMEKYSTAPYLAARQWIPFSSHGGYWLRSQYSDRLQAPSIVALAVLGSNAAPLCPQLLELAQDTNLFWAAEASFEAIGSETVTEMEKICKSPVETMRIRAAKYLAWRKREIYSIHNSFSSFFDIKDGEQRLILIYMPIDPGDSRDLIGLLLFADANAAVRRASAEAIGSCTNSPKQPVASWAVGPLVKALKDPDAEVRFAAGQTLKKIDPKAAAKAGVQ